MFLKGLIVTKTTAAKIIIIAITNIVSIRVKPLD